LIVKRVDVDNDYKKQASFPFHFVNTI